MKQIGNWVFGSFFRTIGRLLVFVLLGFVIANLVDFGSILDNFRITDLFFEKVSAAGITNYGYFNTAYKTDKSQYGNAGYMPDGIRVPLASKDTHVLFNSDANINGSGISLTSSYQYTHVVFQVGLVEVSNVAQVVRSSMVYARYTRNGSLYGATLCSWGGQLDVNYDLSDTEHNRVVYYNLSCPIPVYSGSNIYLSRLTFGLSEASTNEFFEINRNINYILNDNYILEQSQQATTNAITNQTQQQAQQHQETMNSNTTQAESEADGFFGNFTLSDSGGLNSIITAPLNTIRSLLTSSCTNLVLPLPFINTNLTLPCMGSIYSEHFGLFFNLYQTIILAIISYRCIRSLFFDIKGFTNPEDGRIEVMDL